MNRSFAACALLLLASTPLAQDVRAAGSPALAGSRQQAANRDISLELYDIADLAGGAQGEPSEFPAQRLDPDPEGEALRQSQLAADYQALAHIVERHVQPAMGADPAQAVRATEQGVLVVSGTAAQHAWVREFLLTQRRAVGLMHDIQVRIVRLPPEAVERLSLVELPRLMKGPEEAEVLLAGIQDIAGAEVLTAPRVLCHNRSRAEIATIDQIAYVSRWERYEEVAPHGQAVLDPVIEILQEGIWMESRVTSLGDGMLSLDLEVTLAELLNMQTLETELGEISVPHVSTRSLETCLTLRTGNTAVFLGGGDEQEVVVILVRVSEIWPEEPGLEPAPGDGRRKQL